MALPCVTFLGIHTAGPSIMMYYSDAGAIHSWINDFTNADSDTYFQQLSQFLASNPQGTIDVKAFENSANPTDFLKTFPPVGSEGSSPESSSNASHTYADPANIIVPTSGDSNTRNSSRQASADSSDFDQRGKNKNGKRANGETSKKAALKDKKRSASTETGEDAVHHSHEQEQGSFCPSWQPSLC